MFRITAAEFISHKCERKKATKSITNNFSNTFSQSLVLKAGSMLPKKINYICILHAIMPYFNIAYGFFEVFCFPL